MARKALFLDRDGIVNIDHGYVSRIEEFEFVPGILELMRDASRKGYLLLIVTNQSGIGRGYYTLEDFRKLTRWMIRRMREEGIDMDEERVLFCPHAPEEGCGCRKPEPGMILRAAERFDLDLAASWMIGDKDSDMEAARRAGVGHRYRAKSNEKIERKELDGF